MKSFSSWDFKMFYNTTVDSVRKSLSDWLNGAPKSVDFNLRHDSLFIENFNKQGKYACRHTYHFPSKTIILLIQSSINSIREAIYSAE